MRKILPDLIEIFVEWIFFSLILGLCFLLTWLLWEKTG